tara:strand:- start:106 stop:753 length:648 start_codon:yes stop_codon:yes gene_type:complete
MKKIKVAFLLDKSNNWLESDTRAFVKYLKKSKYQFKIYYKYEDIRNYTIVFLLGYTKVIKSDLLINNKINLTVHESNLPENRGFSPIQYQILNKKNTITTCLIKLRKKVDSGEIYEKSKIKFHGDELYEEIRTKQSKNTFNLVSNFLRKYPKNSKTLQKKGKSNFLKKRKPKDSELNIYKSIKDNFNILRISNNDSWPAFFNYKNKKYIIKIFKG